MPAGDESAARDAAFETALAQTASTGVFDGRGMELTQDLLDRLFTTVGGSRDAAQLPSADFRGATFTGPADFRGATFTGRADFREATFTGATFTRGATFTDATFTGDASFPDATFTGDASFPDATFTGDADFTDATFTGDADFTEATFTGRAHFPRATFTGVAYFIGATFTGDANFTDATTGVASFGGATFTGDASFTDATFTGDAYFIGATFTGDADFTEATFTGRAHFPRATFTSDADFTQATFTSDASFGEATFEQPRQFGPFLAYGFVDLGGSEFVRHVTLQVCARRVSLKAAALREGADLFVGWADISLEDTDFGGPSLVTQLPTSALPSPTVVTWTVPETAPTWVCRLDDPPQGLAPRVVSLRRAKVAELTLSGVDLRACRFAGAHGLDDMRLERVVFAPPPPGWHTTPAGWRIRWTQRQTLANEQLWRHDDHGSGWYEEDGPVHAPDWLEDASERLEPEEIAGLYRALRKGREDNKDEAGAADFYYGEMEMRRQSSTRPKGSDFAVGTRAVPWAERQILWLYWLVSGYGLRASRALIALAITVLVLALGLDLWGFRPDKSYGRALLFALESSVSLLRAPTTKLTAGGEVIQIALRLAGPLFFGLAILSLRGRVKR